MPVRPCKHPTCSALLASGRWCDQHRHLAAASPRAEYQRHYDQHQRNKESKAFYNSAAWSRARQEKLTTHPVCERCQRAWADTVHHIKPLAECTSAEKIAQDNLNSLCTPCHGTTEAEITAAKAAR